MKYYDFSNAQLNSDMIVKDILYREDNNFLEGFYYDSERDAFYESSGLYGKSFVHKLNLDQETSILSIDSEQASRLPSKYFGEGLAPRSQMEFALLTYQHRKLFTVDRNTMTILPKRFEIPSDLLEGWGFTADESSANENGYYTMYASDGTAQIFVIDGETMRV